jgi:PKD repeat protein
MKSKTNPTIILGRRTLPKMVKITLPILLLIMVAMSYAQNDSCSAKAYFNLTTTDHKNITITNYSTGSNLKYLWYFMDSTTSTDPNPGTHYYNNVATHYMYLQVTDTIKNCTSSFLDTIFSSCSADFSIIKDHHDFAFSSKSNNPATAIFYWTFGDGSTSSQANPSHHYVNEGIYNISLLVTSKFDTTCSDIGYGSVIAEDSCMAHAYFTVATTDYKNLTITNHSSGSNLTYLWDFGDGATSTNPNPGTHTYSTTAAHSVYLQVTDVIKNCSSVFADTIRIPCSGSFSFTHNQHDFNFTSDASMDPATTTYAWDFGDGGTSTLQNPSHHYINQGAYSACLTVTSTLDVNCSDNRCAYIGITDSTNICSAHFSFTNNQHDFNFTSDTFMNPATTVYAWDFGDGSTSTLQNPSHHFANLVSCNVCLTVTSTIDSNCSDKQCAYIAINTNCFADFYSRPVLDYTYSFEALQNDCDYLWEFGDGTTSTLKSVQHTFPTHDTYNVCLTVTSKSGIICTNKHCEMIDVRNSKHCNAFFTINPDSSTIDPYDFLIYNLSYGNNLTYLWEFGDGTTSTLLNPTHDYAGTGPYFVCLEVRNDSAASRYCATLDLTDTLHHLLPNKFHITVIDKTITGIKKNDLAKTTLLNYPNPFSDITTISYSISTRSAIELDVYNLLGVKVATIDGGTKAPGNYNLEWSAPQLQEGIYLLQLKANDLMITKPIIIAK